tara:strand:+ start:210 stop:356 length:147 start_codon:yes stop_codon:yes gene_type:complete
MINYLKQAIKKGCSVACAISMTILKLTDSLIENLATKVAIKKGRLKRP